MSPLTTIVPASFELGHERSVCRLSSGGTRKKRPPAEFFLGPYLYRMNAVVLSGRAGVRGWQMGRPPQAPRPEGAPRFSAEIVFILVN